jgi:DDE domain
MNSVLSRLIASSWSASTIQVGSRRDRLTPSLDQRYAPELQKRLARYRSRLSFSWRVDETYVKVKGHWRYLYRAIDKDGATLDFFLSERRSAKAAKRFLGAALKRSRDWIPRVINTDKNPAYGEAIAALKKEGTMPRHVEHRQAKYLNNRLEANTSDCFPMNALRQRGNKPAGILNSCWSPANGPVCSTGLSHPRCLCGPVRA